LDEETAKKEKKEELSTSAMLIKESQGEEMAFKSIPLKNNARATLNLRSTRVTFTTALIQGGFKKF
jgi:hypothetical protein